MSSNKAGSLLLFDHETLDKVAPVLSEESYRTLFKELTALKGKAPCASGIGIDHLHSCPTTFEESLHHVNRLKERLDWTRKVGFISELLQRETRRKNRTLHKENQQLKEANEELRTELKRARGQLQSLLGVKKSARKKAAENESEYPPHQKKHKKRGAPKGHRGDTRPIPDKGNTVVAIPPPDICPYCGQSQIHIEKDFISKYVEDIPPIVKTIEERRYYRGTCAHCQGSVIQPEAVSGPPVIVGENLIALLAVMRHKMGSSYRKLSQLCTDTFHIPLSPSGVLGILNRVCRKLEPAYKGIEASLPDQSVLHGDETGWRMDGDRWYLWCFCNGHMVYFHADPSRGSKVPKAILGHDFSGILHADFYAAYNFVKKTQRCLIHLQRTINEEREIRPDDKQLQRLHDDIKDIIITGLSVKKLPDSPEKRTQRKQIEKKLAALTKLKSRHKRTNALIKRLKRYQQDLLRFVDHKDVEYHNNKAERAIRPAVITRKVSFGNRTTQGANNFSILVSVMETCALKKKNLSDFIKEIWKTPHQDIHLITRSLLDST